MVCYLTFLAIGILMVSQFKGKMYYCDFENIEVYLQELVQTAQECMDYGGDWINLPLNYDNI